MKKIIVLLLLCLPLFVTAAEDDITVARRMKMLVVDFDSPVPDQGLLSGKTFSDQLGRMILGSQDILDKVYVVQRESMKNKDLSGFKLDDILGMIQKGQALNVESVLAGKISKQSNGLYQVEMQLIDVQKKNVPTSRRVLNFATAHDIAENVDSILTNLNSIIQTLAAGNFPRVDIITPNFDVVSIIQINKDNFPEMKLSVSVVNVKGDPVSLPPELFEIRENGNMVIANIQKVKTGEEMAAPITILMILDKSPSMLEEIDGRKTGQPFERVKAAAIEFLGKMGPLDTVKVVSFDFDVTELGGYTTDKASYIQKIKDLHVGIGTGLYNVIRYGVEDMAKVKGEKAVILLTDGKNDVRGASAELQKVTLKDALDAAKQSTVPVYSIGFGGADEKVLSEVALNTHSMFFKAISSEKLRELYLKLHNIIENQYIITYRSMADKTGKVSVDLNIKKDERNFNLPEEQLKGNEYKKAEGARTESEKIQLQKKEIQTLQNDLEKRRTEIDQRSKELTAVKLDIEKKQQEIEQKKKEQSDREVLLLKKESDNNSRSEEISRMKDDLALKAKQLSDLDLSLSQKKKEIEEKEKNIASKSIELQKKKIEMETIQNNIRTANNEIVDFLKQKFEYLDKEKEKLDKLSTQTAVTQ